MSSAHSPTTLPLLHLRHSSFSNPSVASSASQLILQPFCCFTYAQFILQPFFCFSYVTSSSLNSPMHRIGLLYIWFFLNMFSFSGLKILSAHSPTFLSLHLCYNSFHRFTYITAHSPTLLLLHLHHRSFPNPYFASPTSQALHLIHLASRPCCALTSISIIILLFQKWWKVLFCWIISWIVYMVLLTIDYLVFIVVYPSEVDEDDFNEGGYIILCVIIVSALLFAMGEFSILLNTLPKSLESFSVFFLQFGRKTRLYKTGDVSEEPAT